MSQQYKACLQIFDSTGRWLSTTDKHDLEKSTVLKTKFNIDKVLLFLYKERLILPVASGSSLLVTLDHTDVNLPYPEFYHLYVDVFRHLNCLLNKRKK